jgi:hypothetical protein
MPDGSTSSSNPQGGEYHEKPNVVKSIRERKKQSRTISQVDERDLSLSSFNSISPVYTKVYASSNYTRLLTTLFTHTHTNCDSRCQRLPPFPLLPIHPPLLDILPTVTRCLHHVDNNKYYQLSNKVHSHCLSLALEIVEFERCYDR